MSRTGKPRLLPRPGAPGRKRFAEKYGDALVAVRYRDDEKSLRQHTTVELVVDESKRIPERCMSDPGRQVRLRTSHEGTALRARIRGGQARWNPSRKLWWVRLAVVVQLSLEERIAAWEPPRVNVSNVR